MKTKLFTTVTSLSMAATFIALLLALVGAAMTGFYPGLPIILFLTLIPIASRRYANKAGSTAFLTVLNILVILVVLWMTFVIVHDRVLGDS